MSAPEQKIRPGGLVAIRERVGVVAERPLEATRKSAGFVEIAFMLGQVRIIAVQVTAERRLARTGDDLALVGQVKDGWVEPVAWWNLTQGAGHAPRTWDFWPCLAGAVLLVALLAVRFALGTLTSLDLLRTAIPLLMLAVLAWSAHTRRRAVRAVEALRAGRSVRL